MDSLEILSRAKLARLTAANGRPDNYENIHSKWTLGGGGGDDTDFPFVPRMLKKQQKMQPLQLCSC